LPDKRNSAVVSDLASGGPLTDPKYSVSESHVSISALDGMEIAGWLFEPQPGTMCAHVAILNSGGGIAAAHYRRFARYLAEGGVPVLTYDYRGIGRSRPPRLRGFRATVEDWAEHDCGGAIALMRARWPMAELIGIAHSIGALLFGGAPNAGELSRFVFVCSHTGYVGDYRWRYRVPMALLWHGLMPALTRMVGYFPARHLGLGDDIPAGVALQWASRRTPDLGGSGITTGSARARTALARCRALHGSALVLAITDDAFATESGTRRLMSYFPSLDARLTRVGPAEAGVRGIGHFGFFRPSVRTTLWPRVLAYILQSPPRRLDSPQVAVTQ
jgi:predicted alpha/beta hydrolase